MNVTHKFANAEDTLSTTQINNGDVVFVKDTQSIFAKMNDETIEFGGKTEWNDIDNTESEASA